jgi:hypothetical protein
MYRPRLERPAVHETSGIRRMKKASLFCGYFGVAELEKFNQRTRQLGSPDGFDELAENH